jgi:hypothetical protein
MDVLFLDGQKKEIGFPFAPEKPLAGGESAPLFANPEHQAVIYRLYPQKDDPAAVVYFDPRDSTVPSAYEPFYDQGELVTPAYWGNHWPLTRGRWTGWTINSGIHTNPAHNSVAGWSEMPTPLARSEYPTVDALGQPRTMTLQRWAALIADTDLSDEALLNWARSYAEPPSLELKGAHVDFPAYSPERRALRLIADAREMEIKVKPSTHAVNPVFELSGVSQEIESVLLEGRPLASNEFTWDGATLWIKADIGAVGKTVEIRFRRVVAPVGENRTMGGK